jgi:site-specific recombinase XerD
VRDPFALCERDEAFRVLSYLFKGKRHRNLRSRRVLCLPDGSGRTRQLVQYRLKRAARRAGLPDLGVHALRHTFCSHLSMRGAPVNSIRELAGHGELGVTQRYLHLSPSALDAAIRLLEDRGEMGEATAEVAANC